MSVSLARNLSKQPGKRFENTIVISGNTRSERDGKLSGGRTSSPGVARLGTLEAIRKPNVAVRTLRPSSSCFPQASPISLSEAGKQKKAPENCSKPLTSPRKFGAGEGIRTLDPNLGKVVLALGSAMRRNLRQR